MFQIRWLWKNLGPKQRTQFITAMILSSFTSVMLLINPMLTSRLFDDVIIAQNPDPLLGILMAMLAVQGLRLGLRYLMIMLFEWSSQKMIYNLRVHLFRVLQYQELRFFDRNRTGDLMTRLSADLDWCRHFVAYLCYQVSDCVIMFVSTLLLFFTISWKLTLALMAAPPLLLIVTGLYKKKSRSQFIGMRERLAELNTAAQENIAGNRVVKAFAQEEQEKDRFRECDRRYRDANLDLNKLWLTFFPFLELLANSMTVITIFVGGAFIMLGEITAGELSVFTSLSWALAAPMRNLGALINDLQRFSASAGKIIEVYYAKPLIADRPDAVPHAELSGRIEFQDVTFSHGQEKVLEQVSFTVEPGQTLAVMGPTGSGKTSLTQLLARFYDPQEGAVLVDGCDVRLWKLNELRRHIGTATQDVFLFSDTVEGNIAFGDPAISEEEARSFARRADASEFVEKMPESYDTIIGERGVGLSGGQKQRIALARAMAVKPSILVLDDTTSALDMETEAYIQKQLRRLPYACTKIIIAQRISSVKDADQILVLKNGRIEQRGTHEELVGQPGYYRETYLLQNDLTEEDVSPAVAAAASGVRKEGERVGQK
ncbi:MAG: ABC transporter ATP-binding protein [Clostridiales bacterium]|nr:ABC transporter ATP-binding protein [Clostridiales bacterium]